MRYPVKAFLAPIFVGALALLAAATCRAEESSPAIEWKESWDATYAFNRERWEKEFKGAPPRPGRRTNTELPSRMVLLLEALLKKYPDDEAHRLGAYSELADQLVKMEARGRACEYHKKIVDESRGKPDAALAALQNILKVCPRYYETPDARQWQEYAGRRLMALYRIGYIASTNPALNEAMECLLAVRSAQGRFLEAAQILDELKAQNRSDDRIKLQEAELYFKLGHIEKALECFQELSYLKQDRGVQQRIALLSSHRWSSNAQQQNPIQGEFDKRWQNILATKVDENIGAVDSLIQDDAQGSGVISSGAQFASAWSTVDAQLRAMPENLQGLRQTHADDAATLLSTVRKSGHVDELMSVFRKYPWTESGQSALLEYGERQLVAGRAVLAARAFQDVLSHSNSKTVNDQAKGGLKLALAQNRGAVDVPAATRPPKKIPLSLPAIFPWPREMVEDIPAEIRPYLSWPGIEVTTLSGRTLLSGPNLLVCFGVDLSKPRWVCAPNMPRGLQGQLDAARVAFFHAPAPVRPHVAGGIVYMRWGLDGTRCYPSHLAAFDLESGETMWSTAQDLVWKQVSPIGDPVVSDGKLFVMAIENGSSRSASALPISLLCLDAKSGATLWQRHLANHQLTTLPRIGQREREWDSEQQRNQRYADVFHYGNAVTVEGGAVYCITNCGVVARVDARDGVIEWLNSYSRTTPNAGAIGYLQREGAAPLISGNRAIFLPRDNEGVFALNKENGQLLWENPFAPSQSAIALTNDALLLADHENVAALDPVTGHARWFRSFAQGIACRPVSDGMSIFAAGADKLQRILAATGASIEEAAWENRQSPAQIALQGDALLIATLQNLNRFPYEQNAAAQAAAAPAGKLELPLKPAWQLMRPNPELIVPPQNAGIPGRVIVSSEGLLECVDAAASGKTVWQLFVPTGLPEFAWEKDTLLLLYPRHVDARDAGSGELKWRCAISFAPEHWLLGAPYLFISETERTPEFGAIEVASGKLLWSKRIDTFHRKTVPLAFDGKKLFLFGARSDADTAVLMLDPKDGSSLGTRVYLPRSEQQPRGTWIDGAQGVLLTEGVTLHTISLQDDKFAMRFHADLKEALRRSDPRATTAIFNWESHFKAVLTGGRWMDIAHYSGRSQRALHFIFDRGDPEYLLRRNTDGEIRGERLFDSSGNALAVIDLPSKTEVARYRIPSAGTADSRVRIVEHWQDGDAMFVVSGLEQPAGNEVKPGALRVDCFDADTGAHRGGQIFTDVPYWKVSLRKFSEEREPTVQKWRETQAVAAGSTLLVTDAQGVHAFAPEAKLKSDGKGPPHNAYRHAGLIVADGLLQDWGRIASLSPGSGRLEAGGTELRVTHNGENLYLAVNYNDPQLRPRNETQEFSSGDWLELGLNTNAGNFRGCVALDARGQSFWEDAAGADKIPGEIQSAARGDLAHGTHMYELAIPLRAIAHTDDPAWRRVGLSAAVWEQTPLGPRKVAEWGGGLAGQQMLTEAHRKIYLDSMTQEEEQAARELALRLPDLKASKSFLQKISATRGDPIGQAGPYLSQWVYLDAARPPNMLMLQLNDGSGWEHRISWGTFEWPLLGTRDTPSRRLGGALPPGGSWQELRVPLAPLGMQELPLCGISFGQHGGGRVCWERTALVVDGKETVLIDGSIPDGKTEGHWEWLSQPKHAAARVHANRAALDTNEALAHAITFAKPIDVHLVKSASKAPSDGAKALALLEEQIPKLGASNEAAAFFQEMLALEAQEPEKIRARLRWFLSALPRHPSNVDLLGQLLQNFKAAGTAQAADEVETVIKAANLPPQTAYDYRRKFVFTQHKFVRNVQVLGPFPDPLDAGQNAALPPEGKAVDLAAKLQMGDYVLEWRPLKSDRDYIDLARALKPSEHVVAFAVCYVQCEKAHGGMLEISADDGCKVWLNQKLIHAHHNPGVAIAGANKTRIFLPAGLNEVLVKINNSKDDWGFFMEFVEADGRGPMQGIEILESPR